MPVFPSFPTVPWTAAPPHRHLTVSTSLTQRIIPPSLQTHQSRPQLRPQISRPPVSVRRPWFPLSLASSPALPGTALTPPGLVPVQSPWMAPAQSPELDLWPSSAPGPAWCLDPKSGLPGSEGAGSPSQLGRGERLAPYGDHIPVQEDHPELQGDEEDAYRQKLQGL